MKLDLGCGDRPYEDGTGWTHMDERQLDDVEIIGDIEFVSGVPWRSCEAIMARHVLEHFSHTETVNVLKRWRQLLVDGGIIHIEVPNLLWQAKTLHEGSDEYSDAEIVFLMFGAQDYKGNYHKTGFTWDTLFDSLEAEGFHDIQIQDIGMVLVAEAKA